MKHSQFGLVMLAALPLSGCSTLPAPAAPSTPGPAAVTVPAPPESLPFFGGRAWPQKQQAVLCVLEGSSRQPCLMSFQLADGRPSWKKKGRYEVLDGGSQGLFSWSLAGSRQLRVQRLDPASGRTLWETAVGISDAGYDTLSCESHPQGAKDLALSWTVQQLPAGGPARIAPKGPRQGAVLLSLASGHPREAKVEVPVAVEAASTGRPEEASPSLAGLTFRVLSQPRRDGFRLDRELQALDGRRLIKYRLQLPDAPDLQRMISIP